MALTAVEQIREAAQLLRDRLITQAEFQALKEAALQSLCAPVASTMTNVNELQRTHEPQPHAQHVRLGTTPLSPDQQPASHRRLQTISHAIVGSEKMTNQQQLLVPSGSDTAPPLLNLQAEALNAEVNVERAERDKQSFKKMYEGTRVKSTAPLMTREQK